MKGRVDVGKVAWIVRLIILILLVQGAYVFSQDCAAFDDEPSYKDTNVIFISIDTLRYDHLGCYGYQRDTSPNIDQLAKRSVVFDNFIVQAYLTPISQMSIFTAQYPRMNGTIGFRSDPGYVPPRRLPEILKYYDYFNAAFLSSPEFFLQKIIHPSGDISKAKSLFSHYFDVYEPTDKVRQIPEKAFAWVEQNKDRKFFLWIAIGTVHWPYAQNVPEPLRNIFDPKEYSPFYLNYDNDPKDFKDGLSHSILRRIYKNDYYLNFTPVYHLTEKDKAFIIGRYDAGIFYTDLFIGKLLLVLEKNKLMDKTLIILYSIHGEDLGEHGYFAHYDIYDTEVKNALIIKFPGNLFKGRRIATQVQGIDIVPTSLDYLGIPSQHSFQGQSFMPLIRNPKKARQTDNVAYVTRIPYWEAFSDRERIKSDAAEHSFQNQGVKKIDIGSDLVNPSCSFYPKSSYPPYDIGLRTNRWKLILRKNKLLLEKVSWWGYISNKKISQEEVELYDLEADPFEQNNVAYLYPAIVDRLKENLLQWDNTIEKQRPKKISTSSDYLIIPYP